MRMSGIVVWGGLVAVAALVSGAFAPRAVALGSSTISVSQDPNNSIAPFGEYLVTKFTNGTSTVFATPDPKVIVPASGSVFETFCIQLEAPATPGTEYNWTLSNNLDNDPSTPLLHKTAWLYEQFFKGTLTGYDYTNSTGPTGRKDSAKALNLALWKVQGELDTGLAESNVMTPQYDDPAQTQAKAFVALADAASPTTNGNTRVLVTTDDNGDPFQDFLIVIQGSGTPGLTLVKSASVATAKPFQAVTYTYTLTNTGGVDLTGIVVHDDAGTPADPSDDYDVGPINLAAGATTQITATVIPPVQFCAIINTVDTPVGVMTVDLDVGPNHDVRARYTQLALNDNTYGTNSSPGWKNGHTFGNLVSSDKCEFIWKDGAGTTKFDGYLDYMTASSTFPTSGYGTLGFNGGDGSLVSGSLSSVHGYDTSLSHNFNNFSTTPKFYTFTTNSPPKDSMGNSIPAGWDYVDWYQMDIDKNLFTANGFGSVTIGVVHNSPPMAGDGPATPKPCDSHVTNTATATATWSGGTITAGPASATVFVDAGTGGSGGGGTVTIASVTTTFKGKSMKVAVKNTGTATANIQSMHLGWPSGDGNLLSVQVGSTKIFQTSSPAPSIDISSFLGQASKHQIGSGKTVTFVFNFAANANTSASNYDLTFDFGSGPVTIIP